MRLTMNERQKLTAVVAPRFQKASKKQKGMILNEFVQATGYGRCYAAYLLRTQGKKVKVNKSLTIVGDVRKPTRRVGAKKYGEKVEHALKKLWLMMDCICSKRLVGILEEIIPTLEKYGEIRLDLKTREKLMKISAATIDRLLREHKQRMGGKGRSGTKPGTLLKSQIPIRTFSDWDEKRPGFVEVDLVGHEGGNGRGDFIQTLDVTDVYTGWTEARAVRNKAQVWVHEALIEIRGCLPFELLGIDSDNGSEFINEHLLRYCEQNRITFTRARSYRKNDNCYVEQKNYSVIRRAVGYNRYDTEEELLLLNQLYKVLGVYTNYFQPTMKLKERERRGSQVKKRYEPALTPFRRVLESSSVPTKQKTRLKREYQELNPAELKRRITALQNKLVDIATRKMRAASPGLRLGRETAFSSRGDHSLSSAQVKLSVKRSSSTR